MLKQKYMAMLRHEIVVIYSNSVLKNLIIHRLVKGVQTLYNVKVLIPKYFSILQAKVLDIYYKALAKLPQESLQKQLSFDTLDFHHMEIKSNQHVSAMDLLPRFETSQIKTPKKYKVLKANILIDENEIKEFRIKKNKKRNSTSKLVSIHDKANGNDRIIF